jgi:hypothetical protein
LPAELAVEALAIFGATLELRLSAAVKLLSADLSAALRRGRARRLKRGRGGMGRAAAARVSAVFMVFLSQAQAGKGDQEGC